MSYFRKVDDESLHLGTAYWKKYIKKRIENNQNFLGCAVGQTGTGKSYSMISLAEILQDGTLDEADVFMKSSDFIRRLKEILEDKTKSYKGKVLIWDEAGKDLNAKEWQKKANRVVNVVLQLFRKENLIVLFTLPYFSFLDSDARKLVHAIFETKKIDRENKKTILKAKLIQVNQDTGKMYKKFLKANHNGKGVSPIKRIELPLPNKDFLPIYENKKDIFTKAVYDEALNDLEVAENRDKSQKSFEKLTKHQWKVLKCMKIYKSQAKVAEIMLNNVKKQPRISESVRLIKEKIGNDAYEAYIGD